MLLYMSNNNNNNYQKGHRKRILKTFLSKDINTLTNLEIIEICLFIVIPRKNVKELAYTLLKKYKYIYLILGASREEILGIPNSGEQTYQFFQLLLILLQYIQKEKIYDKEKFFNLDDVIAYCKWQMCYLTHEELRILYFNSKNKLIKDEIQSTGSLNNVAIYPREIIKKCLQLGAAGIVLCHNHPSGDPTPSKEDITITLDLQKIANLLNIYIHDHIIIGDNNCFSMKRHGLL
jgi:DNA repair protein RadC